MKRTTTGIEAFSKMIACELPLKTSTYTPISHSDVMSRVRSEIVSAGYYITAENYITTNNGQVALGSIQLNYKADPEIQLSANFLNSYNKQYAFRFSLGGMVKGSQNSILLNGDEFGAYKRVHKGSADLLAAGKIQDFISGSAEYWDKLVQHKNLLKASSLDLASFYNILGILFYQKEVLNSFQLNVIGTELKSDFSMEYYDAWTLYNYILTALKDAHPADWMEHHQIVHEVMTEEVLKHAFKTGLAFSSSPVLESGSTFTMSGTSSGTVVGSSSIGVSNDTTTGIYNIESVKSLVDDFAL